jgi:hypothetical protein
MSVFPIGRNGVEIDCFGIYQFRKHDKEHGFPVSALDRWNEWRRRITLVSCPSGSGESHMGYFIQRGYPTPVAVLAAALLATAVFARPMHGQSAPPPIHVGGVELTGIPEDWSSHYVVFSNPGTEQDAINKGRHEQWQRVVNDPRYVMQQLRRHLPVQGPAAGDVANRARWDAEAARSRDDAAAADLRVDPFLRRRLTPERMPQPELKRDWSQSLGVGPGLAVGHFPAKYSFFPTSASCSDYVVFPTGAAGATGQATIVAFNNLYVGTGAGACATTNPTVYWAYNTGTAATAKLSPVLSRDGTQVAFIEVSNASQAALTILRMAPPSSGGGSVTAPATATPVPNTAYNGCTAPCYTALFLGLPTGVNDTNSAPYYLYDGSDTLYVGDDTGKLHQFTGVFNGTPTETTTNGWPATATNQTGTSAALTSPVYDLATGFVFVGDAGGYLNEVLTTGATRTLTSSNRMECGTTGMSDAPVVDSVTDQVYVFVGNGCDNVPNVGNSYVNRFPATTSIGGSGYYGTGVSMGNASTIDTTTLMYHGAFDNLYFVGPGNTGNLYVCVNGTGFQIPMATFSTPTPFTANSFTPVVTPVSDLAGCSPVTEFLGAKATTTLTANLATTGNPALASTAGMANGDYLQIDSEIMLITAVTPTLTVTRGVLGTTAAAHTAGATVLDIQDWLFFSVDANASAAGCTVACIFNYNITTGTIPGAPTAGLSVLGGTGGIIIDNRSTTQVGAGQVYFTTLTGTVAVQASQAGLN